MPQGGQRGGYWSQLQGAYSREYRKLSRQEKQELASAGGNPFNAFKKSPRGSRVFKEFNDTWFNRSRLETNEPIASTSANNPADSRTDDGPESKRQRPNNDSDGEDIFAGLFDDIANLDFDMADIQNNAPGMPTSSSVATGGAAPMEVQAIGGDIGGRGGVGANAAETGVTTIPPIIQNKLMHITFRKRWFKYTYGIAHTAIAPKKSIARVCTPYAYYPVDWVPFYLSKQEFLSLPATSKIVKVSASIQFLGTRTSFDHGTTLSGTATTEYIPIAKYCIGLNNKLFIENRSYKLKATEPMQVEALNEKTLEEYYRAMYLPVGAMEIPRHLNWYCCMLYNKNSPKGLNIDTFQNYRIDQLLTTAMINKTMGSPIINYEYHPKNGYLKTTKKAIIIDYNKEDGFADDIKTNRILYKHTLPQELKIAEDGTIPGVLTCDRVTDATSFDYINRVSNNYFQSVDAYVFVDPLGGQHATFRNQPQVHLGILATPALNPGTDTTNFLNSAVYTVTNAEATVEFNMDSMCVDGECVDWPEDVKFYINKARGFNGYGYQNLGVTSTIEPRLESTRRRPGKPRSGPNSSRGVDKRASTRSDRILSSKIRKQFENLDVTDDVLYSGKQHGGRHYRDFDEQSVSSNGVYGGSDGNIDEYEIVHSQE